MQICGEVEHSNINITDTPGIFNHSKENNNYQNIINKTINLNQDNDFLNNIQQNSEQ